MTDESNVIYQTESEEEYEELKKLYNEFAKQYDIKINKGKLVVIESEDKKGIEIFPQQKKVKIIAIFALKPASELETILTKNNIKIGFSFFETKDNKTIVVNYKKI
jgi:hypothetical protein